MKHFNTLVLNKINEYRDCFPESEFFSELVLLSDEDLTTSLLIKKKQIAEKINQARITAHNDAIKIVVLKKTIDILSRDTTDSIITDMELKITRLNQIIDDAQKIINESLIIDELISYGDDFIYALRYMSMIDSELCEYQYKPPSQ